MQQKKIKIALLGDSLKGGGAEKVHTLLAAYFLKQNIDVHTILNLNIIDYPIEGKILNLGLLKTKDKSITERIKRFLTLKTYIKQEQFDFIIDFRCRNKAWIELFLTRTLFRKNYIPTVHSSHTEWYFTDNHFWAKKLYAKSYKIVSVSHYITNAVQQKYRYKNVQTIYNPIDLKSINQLKKQTCPFADISYIVAVGSMNSDIKQFDKLIACYAKSDLSRQNIRLVIVGDGKLKPLLQASVKNKKLEHFIYFTGFEANPFPYVYQALFSVLCSKHEGFPNVIIESLACSTPVVSFDCISGPNEIIQHNYNGLLVKNQDFEALRSAVESLINNRTLLLQMRKNAPVSIAHLSVENIGRQWLDLFNFNA